MGPLTKSRMRELRPTTCLEVPRYPTEKRRPGARGHVVASIPNVRHYKVLRDRVLHGRLTYRKAGIWTPLTCAS